VDAAVEVVEVVVAVFVETVEVLMAVLNLRAGTRQGPGRDRRRTGQNG